MALSALTHLAARHGGAKLEVTKSNLWSESCIATADWLGGVIPVNCLELSCAALIPKLFCLLQLQTAAQFSEKSLCDLHFGAVQVLCIPCATVRPGIRKPESARIQAAVFPPISSMTDREKIYAKCAKFFAF